MATARGKSKATAKPEVDRPLIAFKGFTKDLTCYGAHAFEVGKTYTHSGKVKACQSGYHACLNPLDVWSYYGLENGNRFCRVHLSGATDAHEGDSKIAAETIFIETEVTLGEMIREGVKYTIENTRKNASEKASGNFSTLAASGRSSQLAASGHSSQLAASGHFSQLAASGHSSQLAASGHYSNLAASGKNSVIAAAAPYCTAEGANGTWISLAEFDDTGKCVGFAVGCIGKGKLKSGVRYMAKGGKLVVAK